MGCGGSRADAIEPRYPESWTRETESTWLTSTEAETPNGGSSSKIHPGCGVEGGMASKENSKVSGRGTETRSSFSFRERRMVNAGTQCGKQPLASSTCTNQQRRSRRSCPEQTSDSKWRTSKEVTVPSKDVSSGSDVASHLAKPNGESSTTQDKEINTKGSSQVK
ncbi:brain and acute leukemia cytoplasmic protein [Astyanax mexicanus]|uniref:brain and acute leukemia cytoplasmic protein n=1 Tax=Astyanax mexicanus TaxID=7994 RepID=UPI000BBD5F4D|nr:brain and acute leukemia cytoplasmic protein [Astyanax mexicanus]